MNKRCVYMICSLVGQVLWGIQLIGLAPFPRLAFTNIAIRSESCMGNDGTIKAEIQTSVLPVTFTLVGPKGEIVPNNTSGLFEGLTAGVYSIRATNKLGERIVASVTMQPFIPLTVRSIKVTNVGVRGEATGAIVIQTRGGLTGNPPIVREGLLAGVYTIGITEGECPPIKIRVQVAEPRAS